MVTDSSNPDGTIAPEEIAFLARRSRGVGMAITAPCAVSTTGRVLDGEWSCQSDDRTSSLAAAAAAIKGSGAVAVLQLHHGGRLCPAGVIGAQPLAPSSLRAGQTGTDAPRGMTEEEIEKTIEAFGHAAKRAILAGFDGIEINGAGGSLLQQFFSPLTNTRTDQWGGPVENRAAFPIAVVEEVQEVVRRNAYRPFSIGYRLSAEEIEEGGITIEQTLELVEGLVACRLDWLHVVTSSYFAGSIRHPEDQRTRTRIIAEKVKKKTLVIGCGAIADPADALRAVDDGADMVALGRALVIDPEWAVKVAEGRIDQIVRCLPSGPTVPEELSIPPRMYRMITGRPGWMNLCQEHQEMEPRFTGSSARMQLVES
jgi:2,4-dienoyl-CoA reductase-like NADH-dependent reductase (Old Yellow Enzyme family)